MTDISIVKNGDGKTTATVTIKNISEGTGTYVIWVHDANPSRPITLPKIDPMTIMRTMTNQLASIAATANGAMANSTICQAQGSGIDDAIANSQLGMDGKCIPPFIESISPSSLEIDDIKKSYEITLTGNFDCVPFGNACESIELQASIQKVQEKGNEGVDCPTFGYIDLNVKATCQSVVPQFGLSGLTIKNASNEVVNTCIVGQSYTAECLISNDSDDVIVQSIVFGVDNFNGTGIQKTGGGLFGGPRKLTFHFVPVYTFTGPNKQVSLTATATLYCSKSTDDTYTTQLTIGTIVVCAPVTCDDITFTAYTEKPDLKRSNGSGNCSTTYSVTGNNLMHITGVYIVSPGGNANIRAASIERYLDGVKFTFACVSNQYPEGAYEVTFETDIPGCSKKFGTINVTGSNGYCMVVEPVNVELLPSSVSVSFTPKIPADFSPNPSCNTQSLDIRIGADLSRQNVGGLTTPIASQTISVTSGTPVNVSIPMTNIGAYECSKNIAVYIITSGASTSCCNDGNNGTVSMFNQVYTKSKIQVSCAHGDSFHLRDSNMTITFNSSDSYRPSSYAARIFGTDMLSSLRVDIAIQYVVKSGFVGSFLEWTADISGSAVAALQTEPDAKVAFACVDTSTGKGQCLYCNSAETAVIIYKSLGKVSDLWPV